MHLHSERFTVRQDLRASQLTRRSALKLLISASGVAFVAACGPAAPPAPAAQPTTAAPPAAAKPAGTTASVSTPAAAAAAAAQQPKTGGTLRWGQVGDLVTIDAVFW